MSENFLIAHRARSPDRAISNDSMFADTCCEIPFTQLRANRISAQRATPAFGQNTRRSYELKIWVRRIKVRFGRLNAQPLGPALRKSAQKMRDDCDTLT